MKSAASRSEWTSLSAAASRIIPGLGLAAGAIVGVGVEADDDIVDRRPEAKFLS
jgi:hypothetical protein